MKAITIKAITIKQPWASLICKGIKDVENRSWKCPEKYIGKRVLIHSSATIARLHTFDRALTQEQRKFARNKLDGEYLTLKTGQIIGSVEIVDCVQDSKSIWAIPGQWHWVLANPILFDKPVSNIKGKLSFWESYYDEIICPNCGQIQAAKVEVSMPFNVYIHNCHSCGYTIMESEWEHVK